MKQDVAISNMLKDGWEVRDSKMLILDKEYPPYKVSIINYNSSQSKWGAEVYDKSTFYIGCSVSLGLEELVIEANKYAKILMLSE